MSDPITLKSGATLQANVASFKAANRLLKAIALELARVNLDFDLASLKDIGTKDINTLKNVLLQLLASDAVEAAAIECAKKSLYNGQRIIEETFESEMTRPDYLPSMVEVIKVNLIPFFSGLDLALLTSAKPQSNAQKSE